MLKKVSLIILVSTSFLFSLQANAGFREALSALQHKDAELMIAEVEKGVVAKNHDGLSLFISTLNAQYLREEFVPEQVIKDRLRRDYRLPLDYENQFIRWDGFLSESQVSRLAGILQRQKSIDYQETEGTLKIVLANLQKIKIPEVDLKAINNEQYYVKKSAKIELRYSTSQAKKPDEIKPMIEFYSNSPAHALEIYADGLVRYTAGESSHHYNRDLAQIVGRDEWRISSVDVEKLYEELVSIGIYKMPKDKVTPILCDTGEASTFNMLTLNRANQMKDVSFHGWVNLKKEEHVELMAIRYVLEKYVPTASLRCGEKTSDLAYVSCLSSDSKDAKKASFWIKEHKTEK
jgi:hypothetical protein